jgi:hypothetical protein
MLAVADRGTDAAQDSETVRMLLAEPPAGRFGISAV